MLRIPKKKSNQSRSGENVVNAVNPNHPNILVRFTQYVNKLSFLFQPIGAVPLIVCGLILLTLGLLSIKFTFSDIILAERLKMRQGYPQYELWLNPQPEVRLNVYIFTVENADEFMSGTDSKIKIKEIGPIAYREYLEHRDVVFHENSTIS